MGYPGSRKFHRRRTDLAGESSAAWRWPWRRNYVASSFLLMAGMFIYIGKKTSKHMELYKGAAAEAADILEKKLKD